MLYRIVSFIVLFLFVFVMLYFHNESGQHHDSSNEKAISTKEIAF
ncbi:MAG TPA: hypothetical protein VEV44_11675 [Pseudoneobacillus sp.]|nr:hypothetical protein [Pseudoneobacillus sp.]